MCVFRIGIRVLFMHLIQSIKAGKERARGSGPGTYHVEGRSEVLIYPYKFYFYGHVAVTILSASSPTFTFMNLKLLVLVTLLLQLQLYKSGWGSQNCHRYMLKHRRL